ncbi:hypothetical protein N7481_000807 [Penicillium waksmanii]|uniref:uncharacterized protein n=1 Tax=Penicillium waksmanii TaxID=69791 RepID=UPI0025493582|nr:uncharacterized protein N7481_000807 [Penicillium waksmanii]KAJ6000398.1 hypothetical protein N7481_000807 [Penicillium waksmanii]
MAKPHPSWGLAGPETPASPRTMRTLRKIQSHQVLTTSNALIAQTQSRPSPARTHDSNSTDSPGGPTRTLTHRRARSNSDAAAREAALAAPIPHHRRPARKTGSGIGVKRSLLENLLRDGPQYGKTREGLQELKYLVLSTKVDADGDGMSPYRIYLWLVLLNIPPVPTDDYLTLAALLPTRRSATTPSEHSPQTPLFKRRVTEASLIRLLNAVAWKLHDSKPKSRSRPTSSRRREMELLVNTPPSIAEEPGSSDSAIYVQGMNVLCAPFLYAARSEVEAFALFHYFVTQECPGYIRGALDGVHKGLRLVDRCLEIVEPKLAAYLASKSLTAELYAFASVLTLSACTPPLPEVLHLWDFLFAYGPHLNILCIVAQLVRIRDTIFQSDSPGRVLRSFPPLEAKGIIAMAVSFIPKIPADLYEEMINHAK